MSMDLIIANGRVVTGEKTVRADIGIRGGKIASIAPKLARKHAGRTRVIDASDRYVLPGAIDEHVHLDLSVGGMVTADDFESGTQMAACGGVTSIVDFVTPHRGESLQRALNERRGQAEGKACVDYGFHMSLTDLSRQAREVPRMIELGIPTFKQYMIYAKAGLQSNDGEIFAALELLREVGGRLLLHAETPDVLDLLVERNHTRSQMNRYGARLHARTRPDFIEAQAVARAIEWARITRGSLFIVHVSAGKSVDLIEQAQQEGVSVRGETCPHYLALTERVFGGSDGHLYATCPQVKKLSDQRRLWEGLKSGVIGCVSTDTCSFTRTQKNRWGGDFTRIPMGLPGSETMVPIVYTHGVLKRRLTINELVDRCCTTPAKVMGLYPRKGILRVGSDADIVIVHPTQRRRVDWRLLHSRCDWSPYQGWSLAGFAEHAFCRGIQIVKDYQFIGHAGFGQYVPRSLSCLVMCE